MTLRKAARIALVAGAVGSLALMLRAGRSTPRLLLAGFVLWILSPFVVLAWATTASGRWSALSRTTLDVVTLLITLASVAGYAAVPRVPVFVVVAPASWVLTLVALGIAALASRDRPSRGGV